MSKRAFRRGSLEVSVELRGSAAPGAGVDAILSMDDAELTGVHHWAAVLRRSGGGVVDESIRSTWAGLGDSGLPPGSLVVTPGGALPVRRLIHAVVLDYKGRVDRAALRTALDALPDRLEREGCRHLELPLPPEPPVCDVVAQALFAWSTRDDGPTTVCLVTLDEATHARLIDVVGAALPAPSPSRQDSLETPWWDVFLCKKSEALGMAQELRQRLTDHGLRVFLSEEHVTEAGDSRFSRVIDDALEHARHLVVVASSRAHLDSPWVCREWETFLNELASGRKQGNVVTVLVEPMTVGDLPIALRRFQAVAATPAGIDAMVPLLRAPGPAPSRPGGTE